RAEHPKGHRIPHQDPELPILSERGRAAGLGRCAHEANPTPTRLFHPTAANTGLADRALRRVPGPGGLAVADRTAQYRDLYRRSVPPSSLSRDSEPAAVAGSRPIVVGGVVSDPQAYPVRPEREQGGGHGRCDDPRAR